MKPKVKREKFDASRASEQFEKYKETGNGKMPNLSPNQVGYSEAYEEGWNRIFGKNGEKKE